MDSIWMKYGELVIVNVIGWDLYEGSSEYWMDGETSWLVSCERWKCREVDRRGLEEIFENDKMWIVFEWSLKKWWLLM